MTPENRRSNVQQEWTQAENSLAAAEHLLTGRFYAEAVARAYYAAFHAARAALLSQDLEPTTHSGVRSEFARCFVHSGKFDATVARTLGSLQKEREDADYSRGVVWDEATAGDALAGARLFCQQAKQLIETAGHL